MQLLLDCRGCRLRPDRLAEDCAVSLLSTSLYDSQPAAKEYNKKPGKL
jgi:hypothetical protein